MSYYPINKRVLFVFGCNDPFINELVRVGLFFVGITPQPDMTRHDRLPFLNRLSSCHLINGDVLQVMNNLWNLCFIGN